MFIIFVIWKLEQVRRSCVASLRLDVTFKQQVIGVKSRSPRIATRGNNSRSHYKVQILPALSRDGESEAQGQEAMTVVLISKGEFYALLLCNLH